MAFPEPNLRRLEQLERMLETMDRMDPTRMDTATAQHYDFHPMAAPQASLPPPPHRLHQMDQRVPMQMDREGRGWMYPQEPRGRALPTPQQLAAARQHQMLTNARGGANNWAVEMEQRRLIELRQMQLAKENEMYGGATPTGGIPPPQGYKASHPSKPNISLLPTAVMRHMHTNKPGQAVSWGTAKAGADPVIFTLHPCRVLTFPRLPQSATGWIKVCKYPLADGLDLSWGRGPHSGGWGYRRTCVPISVGLVQDPTE